MNRRAFLGGFISAIAAPAIVRPELLMPVKSIILPKHSCGCNNLLSIQEITREAVKLWKNSNYFIQNIDRQYNDAFSVNAIVGSQLKIRLPNDYKVT